MASIAKRGKKYIVRWRDPDGVERIRTAPDLDTAKRLRQEVERAVSLGNRWEPADARALPALLELDDEGEVIGGLFADYLEVARGRYVAGTIRHYNRALRSFAVHLAERHPRKRRLTVDLLTRDAVEAWYGTLRQRVEISTARLYVGALLACWEWARDSESYEQHVGKLRKIEMPSPTFVTAAAPTWEQMDAVIAAAHQRGEDCRTETERRGWTWRARLLTLLRFTGVRANEQAMQLRWDDVDLQAAELTIRGELGKSVQERQGRIVPLSPHLVEEMSGWGTRDGYLIAPANAFRLSHSIQISELWEATGAPRKIWDAPVGRRKGNPHHAFRKGFKTGLSRLGVEQDVRDYLVGHHRGVDHHYLDTLEQAREAVRMVPPLTRDQSVITIRRTYGSAEGER